MLIRLISVVNNQKSKCKLGFLFYSVDIAHLIKVVDDILYRRRLIMSYTMCQTSS